MARMLAHTSDDWQLQSSNNLLPVVWIKPMIVAPEHLSSVKHYHHSLTLSLLGSMRQSNGWADGQTNSHTLREALSFWTMLACWSLTFSLRKGTEKIKVAATTSFFSVLTELVIQSALYRTHKYHTDQKTVFSQHVILPERLRLGAFYWYWSFMNCYLSKMLITGVIKFLNHIWRSNSEDQQKEE